MSEETGKWVLVAYFEHEPFDVYGLFNTEQEAWDYAEKHRADFDACAVKSVLNAFYEEV